MKEYLESQLKMTITIEESQDNYQGLPLLYKTQYRIYTVSSNGVIWMALEPKKFLGLAKLRGNRAYLEKVKQMNCVLFLEDATFYSVEKMKEEGIPFVLKGKEVFLPFLGMILSNNGQRTLKPVHVISFLTQKMLLIGLYEEFDKAISWAAEKGITTGWKDNTFRPWDTCKRAAIVTFIWRYAGKPAAGAAASFTDMTGNEEFDKAISWAAEKGITTGYEEDNTFRPYITCKRLAVVSFLQRYASGLEG